MSSLRSAAPNAEKPEGGDGRPRPGRKPVSDESRERMSASQRRRFNPCGVVGIPPWIEDDFDERF